jgi:predicted membrane-bound spermidine synthase
MLLVLVNIFILLVGIGISLSALFWKHSALRPSEAIRAFIATIVGMSGLALFFFQSFIMTTQPGENVITLFQAWLSSK